jgi:alkylhydroperoxidase family enzyme
MTHIRQLAAGKTELDKVWGLRPAYYALFMQDFNRSIARIDPELIEQCRLRMANLMSCDFHRGLRYRPALAQGLTEDKIAAIPNYPESPLFSERERICIEFAEKFVIQSISIDDDDVKRVLTVLSPEELIYFVKALSVVDQFQRACVAFGIRLDGAVPESLSDFQLAPSTIHH